jgi:hypothetical protein
MRKCGHEEITGILLEDPQWLLKEEWFNKCERCKARRKKQEASKKTCDMLLLRGKHLEANFFLFIGVSMENTFRWFRESLYQAFYDWLDVNKGQIGRWYADLYEKAKKGEAECTTFMQIMGDAMWMLNMIANLGVLAGVGPNTYNLQDLREGLDKKSSERMLILISSVLCLQYLPRDIISQEWPIISSKKFSLKLFTDTY